MEPYPFMKSEMMRDHTQDFGEVPTGQCYCKFCELYFYGRSDRTVCRKCEDERGFCA